MSVESADSVLDVIARQTLACELLAARSLLIEEGKWVEERHATAFQMKFEVLSKRWQP